MDYNEHREKLVNEALATLAEHFDAVQIMASVHEEDGTMKVLKGAGNTDARLGMAQDIVNASLAAHVAAQIELNQLEAQLGDITLDEEDDEDGFSFKEPS